MSLNYVDLLILATTNITAHGLRQSSLPQWKPSTHVVRVRTRNRIRHNAAPSNETTNHKRHPPARSQGFHFDIHTKIQTSIVPRPSHHKIHPINDTQLQTPSKSYISPHKSRSKRRIVSQTSKRQTPTPPPPLFPSTRLLPPLPTHRPARQIHLMPRMFRIRFFCHPQYQPYPSLPLPLPLIAWWSNIRTGANIR